jgi:hypothetical protein
MIDVLRIDENNKKIKLFDLKVGSVPEGKGFLSSFYNFKWYYQAVFYQKLIIFLYNLYLKGGGKDEYEFEDFEFIYMNVNTPNYPIFYKFDKQLHHDLYKTGFINELGKEIPSILTICDAYLYYKNIIDSNTIPNEYIVPYFIYLKDFTLNINKLM